MRAATTASPPVSLGLPVYNGQRFVAQMLDSVCSQTFGDFELVISDNASTDATEEICRDFARKDSRITYTRSAENRGAAWNHNNVIHLSGGEFFKWIADDDICAPTFLQRSIETFRSEPPVVVLVYPQSTSRVARRSARFATPQKSRQQTVARSALRVFPVNVRSPTAVPNVIPSRFLSVEKTEGSGLPSGVSLPVSRLSPFRLSMVIVSNVRRNRSRKTTKLGSDT